MNRGDARFYSVLGLLAVAAIISVAIRYGKAVPLKQDLRQFPLNIGNWRGADGGDLPESVQQVLKATAYVSRYYANASNQARASLFVGYYGEQRAGESMHSPKNCLPGGGWEIMDSRRVPLEIPALKKTIEVNYYWLQQDQAKQFVLYWYDTHGRAFANEYEGKLILVWEALRTGKTDGALIRVVVPYGGSSSTAAEAAATDLARQVYPVLREYLPD
jgi:EpsI family protein